MNPFQLLNIIIIIVLYEAATVNSLEPEKYCSKKFEDKCKAFNKSIHTGCSSNSNKVGVVIKLSNDERISLTKYFNEIRNEIALSSGHQGATMRDLKWSDEYEYLAEKAIEKLYTHDKGCFWTDDNSNMYPTELYIAKKSELINGTWFVFVINGVSEGTVMTEVEFQKKNKINYLLDQEKNAILDSSWSLFHDADADQIGCAWSRLGGNDFDYQQIRCIVNSNILHNHDDSTNSSNANRSTSISFDTNFWLISIGVILVLTKFKN